MTKIKQSMNNYFIVTPPGLEDLAVSELRDKWDQIKVHLIDCADSKEELSIERIEIEKGGFNLKLPGLSGCLLNYYLKIPTEIRLNLLSFHAKDFPKIYQKSKKYNWQKILKNELVSVNCTTKNSRLIHSDRISSTVKSAIEDFFKNKENKESFKNNKFEQNLFVRMHDDILTISLNTSGNGALYKRNQKTLKARAPIRENLAFACLYKLSKEVQNKEMSLCDPMCGSQTILIEARDFHLANTQRDFAFEHTRPFQSIKYKLKNYKNIQFNTKFTILDGSDRIQQEKIDGINFIQNDIFENENKSSQKYDIILTNLPYGKRIKLNRPIIDFPNIIKKTLTYNIFGYICAHNMEDQTMLEFSNGGIPVKLFKGY